MIDGRALLLLAIVAGLIAWWPASIEAQEQTSYSEKISQIEAMDIELRDELRRKKEHFDRLQPEQQAALRDFHQQLEAHADSQKLRKVMNSYYEWLKTLSDTQRMKLLDLPPDERLKQIREIKKAQNIELFDRIGPTRLPAEDARTVYNWIEQIVDTKSNEIKSKFRQLQNNRTIRHINPRWSASRLLNIIIRYAPEQLEGLIKPSDIEELKSHLSARSREIIDEQSEVERPQLILKWIEVASHVKHRPPVVSNRDLQQTYDRLTADERDALDRMHPRDRNEKLRQYHLRMSRIRQSGSRPVPPQGPPSNEHEKN